jgi:hypothetical protein
MQAARRNSYAPSSGPSPLPDSDSEFRNGVLMADAGGETRHPPLPFYATPCDRRLPQRVERVTFERRTLGREHDNDRLVRHTLTLALRE